MTLKTTPSEASVTEFLNTITDPAKREDCYTLLDMMREITGEEAVMWGPAMIGFGIYHYVYDSGREGEWFITGFSPRKQQISIYIMDGFKGKDPLLANLGKHKTSVSCLYVKRLADLDLKVLDQLLRQSVKAMKARYNT